jgi:membrane-associated protease RseP (regulator of RpoE activity)
VLAAAWFLSPAASVPFSAVVQDRSEPASPEELERQVERIERELERARQELEEAERRAEEANRPVASLGVAAVADAQASTSADLEPNVGLLLTEVAAESAAADAGLRQGDVLVELDGQLLINFEQLAVLVQRMQPGNVVEITLVRDGQELDVEAELGERAGPRLERRPGDGRSMGRGSLRMGDNLPMRLELTPEQMREENLEFESLRRQMQEQRELMLQELRDSNPRPATRPAADEMEF